MATRVKVHDRTGIVLRDIQRKGSLFIRFQIEEVEAKADPITPKLTGDLRRRKLKRVQGLRGFIIWKTVYAAYQERGKRRDMTRVVRKYTTGGTGSQFAYLGVSRATKDGGIKAMRRANLVQR